jgi:diguanylate cyclase (GGDEF)-like protein
VKKRKLIGVIISEVEGSYQHKLLTGIMTKCYSLNYDVVVFATFVKNTYLKEYNLGEKNIFHLIEFDLFDGIIVASTTLAMEGLKQEIQNLLLEKSKCPVIYVDEISKHFPSVCTNDRVYAERIVSHLIERHGYHDIFCLAADPDLPAVQNRVNGYRDALRKNGIIPDESRISYEGDFWYTGGEKLAEEIVGGVVAKPRAVACMNDFMAVGLINELHRHGIRVPEDIAVTGFEAADEAAVCDTSITTFPIPVTETGIRTVCEIDRLLTGREHEDIKTEELSIELGHSCGCKGIDHMRKSRLLRMEEEMERYRTLLDSYMTEVLTAVAGFEEGIQKLVPYLQSLKEYSDFYLCLCDNWDGSSDTYYPGFVNSRMEGYTNQMRMALACKQQNLIGTNSMFVRKDLIPDLWDDRKDPKTYYFTPLHFNDYCMGYSVLAYDTVRTFDITYRNWSRNIMNVLQFYRVHQVLYRSSFRDVLTGLYNRNGLEQNLSNVVKDVIGRKSKLLVLMADLDNLKEINDSFGHKEGDNIIQVVAHVIKRSLYNSQIAARIGGDEFLVIGRQDPVQNPDNILVMWINQRIEEYNETSKKPYQIKISMGIFCDYIDEDTNIKEIIDLADHRMYANKAIHKSHLTSYNTDSGV